MPSPPQDSPQQLRTRCAELLEQVDLKEHQLALVNGLLRTIMTGASITDVLKVFASNLKTVCPFDRASISLVDYERKVFHIPFMILGGRVQETREPPRAFGATVLTTVVEGRRPILRSDIRRETRFKTDDEFVKRSFACELIFPLQVGDKVFGTFQVGCYEAGRLTHDHLRLLNEITPAIAVAVHEHFADRKFIFV